MARCPAHEDRDPSLSISEGREGQPLVHCFAGCTYEAVVAALGLDAPHPAETGSTTRLRRQAPAASVRVSCSFGREESAATWAASVARVRDDAVVEVDRDVYDYLASRQLDESWEAGTFGILSADTEVPQAIRWWANAGLRIVAPLFDGNGQLTSIQARRITSEAPKTMFPAGARAAGLVFANEAGRALLRGKSPEGGLVVVGEGLTDYLALTIVSSVPVLAVPGASTAGSSIGPWVRGRHLVLAMDRDDAGARARSEVASRAVGQGAASVRELQWPPGCKDASDVLQHFGRGPFEDALARHFGGGR